MLFLKKYSVFQVVLSAILFVALLQLIYLSLLVNLHDKQQTYTYSELFGSKRNPQTNEEIRHWNSQPRERNVKMDRLRYSLSSRGLLDSSGRYRVYKNLIMSDFTTNQRLGADPSPHHLALATHTTINNLHHLDSLLERWQNPLSLAVFAHGQDVEVATALIYALSVFCPRVRALVDFHLVCHSEEIASFPEQVMVHFAVLKEQGCPSVVTKLKSLRDKYKNYAIGTNVPYPNNLIRNVARTGTDAAYVLVLDIDVVPSADLHKQFVRMLMNHKPAQDEVLVLPPFEIKHPEKMPATKFELVQLHLDGEVRTFCEEVCPYCHAPTNFSRWIKLESNDAGILEVAYTQTWAHPWEPYYIGAKSVPLFPESFRQFGYDRISHACELHVAGFRFSVVSNAFVVHQGFKIKGGFHKRKEEENDKNNLLFRKFKKGLKNKYPNSTRQC